MKTVYLLHQPKTRRYKIGKTLTGTPWDRLKACQTGNSNKLRLLFYEEVDDPTGWEGFFHSNFGEHRLEGEWFILSDRDIKEIMYLLKIPFQNWIWMYQNNHRSAVPIHILERIRIREFLERKVPV